MNLNPVTSSASKAEELAALKKAAQLFQPGTYLHDLFTERFFDWIENQMRNDFPPDVYDVIDALQKEAAQANGARIQAETEAARTKKEAARESETMTTQNRLLNESLARLQRESLEWESMYAEARHECESLRSQAAAAQDEITRLKAKLYDAQMRLNNIPE